jgi:hypothetical protein
MYDPTETDLSKQELKSILDECSKQRIPVCLIGGWASYFYVNKNYRRAFGQDYMGSRDIDLFFPSENEKEFAEVVKKMGFSKNGFKFRYEKIYDRNTKKCISQEQAKKEQIYNLIYIFLDLFSNNETKEVGSWSDIPPMKSITFSLVETFNIADIDSLVALKGIALFARDKADKENKDACDLYALLNYSGKEIKPTKLLEESIKKILNRSDLLYAIAENVLLDPGKQNIVEVTLNKRLNNIT